MFKYLKQKLCFEFRLLEIVSSFGFRISNVETKPSEAFAKLLKRRGNRQSGQAKRDPESRIFNKFWIPAFAGMTE